jgi:creatinine amidohydrolase/Fe(II)-dependent formamide hydrolase-like protein
MKLEYAFPEQIEKAKQEKWPLIIPVGVIEYHACHCCLGTDTLVVTGLLERFVMKRKEVVVAPPIWYGPASYAVGGPEKGSIDIDYDVFENYVYNILKALLYGGWKNIYMIMAHQTEALNPMELSCHKAGRKLVFEYLQDKMGIGWWGNNDYKDFYETLGENENPWNWIKVMPTVDRNLPWKQDDHAGKFETSILWALYRDAVRPELMENSKEWFASAAKDASVELGEKMVEQIINDWMTRIK